jgi:hypothetical protein
MMKTEFHTGREMSAYSTCGTKTMCCVEELRKKVSFLETPQGNNFLNLRESKVRKVKTELLNIQPLCIRKIPRKYELQLVTHDTSNQRFPHFLVIA